MRITDKITMTVVWVFAVLVVSVLAAGAWRLLGLPPGTTFVVTMPFGLYAGVKCGRVWNA